MFKRINLWYCFPPFLILCVFVAALSFVHSQNGSSQKIVARIGSPDGQVIELNEEEYATFLAEQKATEEMYEAMRMEPIARRILLLSTETLDESFLKLATYDDGQYFEPGYMTQRSDENTDMQTLLSNRRVIKILQEFERLPLDQAKIKAKELHKIALDNLYRAIDADLNFLVLELNEFEHAKFMATTSVLLSASLGDIPFLMQRIEEWEQMIAEMRKRIQADESIYPPDVVEAYSPNSFFFFDPTCFVSILMFAVERSGNIPETVKNKIAEADCRIVDIPLVAWNANKTYYDDLRHRETGDTISWETTQTFFRVYNFPIGNELYRQQSKKFLRSLQETIESMN